MKAVPRQFAESLADALTDATPAQTEKAAGVLIDHLASHGKLRMLPRIVRALDTVWRERFGAARIRIASAHPISAALRERLERLAPGADLETSVDASLIGGAIVCIDDRQLDASVAGSLARLEHDLVHGS